MTQAPSFSNRATLEDCHTNLFSLTDLGGIRWRRLSHKGNGVFANRTVEPHNDLILSSYSKCLQAELLCVWRRVLPPVDPYGPQQAPVNFLNGPKELWIFWYGEEPDFASLVHPDLLACNEAQSGTLSQGSWEEGLSYECRTLLFKALHNLIERCLLARDYVRLGRWFIQPYPSASSPTPPDASHLAFSFTYFLHGESTVVCSLDVRQQVAVRRVQSSHLVASQHSELGTQVLLAPWGLAGTLTGVSWKLGDPVCDQTLKEWRQFYPIPMDFQHLDVPPVIEVSISGMRVRYPSIYVLVTDLDTHSPQQQKQGLVAKPSSPMSGSLAYGEPAAPYAAAAKHCPIVGGTASRRVLASSRHDSIAKADNTNESMVEVGDPLAKSPCHCPSKRKNSQITSGSSQARTKLTFHKRQANQSHIPSTVGPSGGVEPTKLTVPLAPTYVKTGMKPPMEKSPACSVGPSPYSAGPRSMPMLSPQAVHSVEQPPASVESKATPYDFVNSASNVHQSPVSNLGKDPFTPRSVQPAENKPASVEPQLDVDVDNEPSLNSLYDYGVTKAWLNHPVKSLRYQDMHPEGKIAIDARGGPEDGEFHEVRPSSQQEGEERGVKRKEPFREEDDSKLYTLKGLEPSYSDLDNMFEDDTPDGSDPIPPTPPGSNKPSDSVSEETKLIIAKTAMASPGGFLGPAELSKMFPTPPSHEHPLPSPMDVGSPPSPNIELDKDFVYRPFPVSYIVSSDTYSPLLDLPSSRLPPLVLAKEFVYVPEPRQMNRQFNRPPSLPVRAPIPLVPRPGVSPISPSPFTPQRNSHATGMPTLHANALLVNVLLSDSLLNVFRDHNFESCSLCVCNAGPNLVGNIKGRDSALYLPDALKKNPTEDDAIVCDCGFSALVNRRLASGSGLFYEDESDICGVQHTYDPANNRKIPLQNLIQTLCKLPPKEALQLFSDCGFPLSNQTTGDNPAVIDHPGQALIDLIRDQCNVVLNECNSLCSLSTKSPVVERILNHLEFIDGCEIVQMVMEQARIGPDPYMGRYDPYYQRPEKTQPKPLHRWPHVQTVSASCSQDVLRVMKCLQPLLQEATQKRRTPRLWEAGFTVQGPLTWRQFHRIIAKGTDDNCEALPIPLVLCGFDRDWLCVGPHSFLYWERLTLEPYAAQRDVAYVVVTPDSEYLVSCVKMFFKEVSSTYENCRLGKHRPITKVLRDGILRVNRSTLAKLQSEPIDEWFNAIGDSNVATLLKAYAQACRNSLAPHLATLPLDHSLLEYNSGGPKTMAPPITITNANDQENQQQQQAQPTEDNSMAAQNPQYPNQSTNNLQSQSQQGTEEAPPPAQEQNNNDEDDADPPTIVVYVLDPFSYGPFKNDVNLRRFGTIGLLRCLNQMTQALSENLQGNIVVQLISMESVLSIKNQSPEVHRAAAFQVYSQCRRSLIHQCNVVKSLTGLGPAAQLDAFLKTRSERYKIPHRLYCPPYVLAPVCEKGSENEFGANSLMSLPKDKSQTLYVSYCLSHDQRYLLATATDDRGELRESCTISIEVPRRRKRISARRHALNRLMDFIVGVMSQGVLPWRLVIGRLGRVGHGELKGWSSLLSKHALQKISQQIGDMCGQCGLMSPLEMPGIISACLISLEPDSAIQVFADQVTPDDRASNQTAMGNLSTPEDSSTTHILVFPMSAATSLPQQFMPGGNDMNPDLEEDIGLFGNLEDEIGGDMLGNDFGDMGDMGDLFSSWPDVDGEMAPGSPSNGVGQGQMQAQHQQNEFGGYMNDPNCVSHMGGTGRPMGEMEEVGLVLQQPLALGYYVSTAGTGTMPDWFWSSCPHLHGNNPVFLKASLHLHSSSVHQNSDDNPISQSANPNGKCHPLDSKYTTDVLRFVLEGYNALSWLAVDASGKDRRSCLPVHIQLLVQLYHAFSNLI